MNKREKEIIEPLETPEYFTSSDEKVGDDEELEDLESEKESSSHTSQEELDSENELCDIELPSGFRQYLDSMPSAARDLFLEFSDKDMEGDEELEDLESEKESSSHTNQEEPDGENESSDIEPEFQLRSRQTLDTLELPTLDTSQEEMDFGEESDDFYPDAQSVMEVLLKDYTDEELDAFTRDTGFDPITEPELLFALWECIRAPLPPGWEKCKDSSGEIFYTHTSTGDTPRDPPMKEIFHQLVAQVHEAHLSEATAEGTETKVENDTKEEKQETLDNELCTIQKEMESEEESNDSESGQEVFHQLVGQVHEAHLSEATAEGTETKVENDTKEEEQETLETPEDLTSSDQEVGEEEEEQEYLESEKESSSYTSQDEPDSESESSDIEPEFQLRFRQNLDTLTLPALDTSQEETDSEEESDDFYPDAQSVTEDLLKDYTDEEIDAFTRDTGFDPNTEPELLWILLECIRAPLPPGWEKCKDSSGGIFYTHTSTGDTPRDPPIKKDFCHLLSLMRKAMLSAATAEGTETKMENDRKEEKQEPLENKLYTIQEETESEEESNDVNPDAQSVMEDLLKDYTKKEIHMYAEHLGIDLDTEPQLLWMVMAAIEAPLPPGWEQWEDINGVIFYTKISNGHTTQVHPTDEYYQQMVIMMRDDTCLKSTPEGTETSPSQDVEEEREHLTRDLYTSQEESESGEESSDSEPGQEVFHQLASQVHEANLSEATAEGTETKMENDMKEEEYCKEYEEVCNLNEDEDSEKRALQQHLLSERSEEARLKEESDRMLKELIESVQQERERQQLQVREESEVFLKEQCVALEKQEAAERLKLEVQKNQNVESLRADMEEALQAERKKLQGEIEEELSYLKQELTNIHQKMREEMQIYHQTKMKQLREDHEKEMHSIRQQCQDEVEVLRKNIMTALQEDRKHLQDSCAAQLEKLHFEFDAQMQTAQKMRSQKASELQDLEDKIELRAKDLKIQKTMLQTKEADLERKRRKLEEEEDQVDKQIEVVHVHEKRDVSPHVCVCQALHQLLQETDHLKQTDEATVVESFREETHKALEENKILKMKVKRLEKERQEALEEMRRAKVEDERLREERDKAVEDSKRAELKFKRLKKEREEDLEERRTAKVDKKFLEEKVLLLRERCDLLSGIISVMENGGEVNASPRPEPERDEHKVPSCYRSVEDLFSPPLSPEPQSLSSPERLRSSYASTCILLEAQTSSSQSSNQEEAVTDEEIEDLQQEVKRLLELQQMFEMQDTAMCLADVSLTESDLSSSVEPPDNTGGSPAASEDLDHLEAFPSSMSGQFDTIMSALTALQAEHHSLEV